MAEGRPAQAAERNSAVATLEQERKRQEIERKREQLLEQARKLGRARGRGE